MESRFNGFEAEACKNFIIMPHFGLPIPRMSPFESDKTVNSPFRWFDVDFLFVELFTLPEPNMDNLIFFFCLDFSYEVGFLVITYKF
jgi:hypothetical protein